MRAFTGREREVLELMATGQANAELADEGFVGLGTVEKHVSTIFDKLSPKPGDGGASPSPGSSEVATAGGALGALAAWLLTREKHLFGYFKAR